MKDSDIKHLCNSSPEGEFTKQYRNRSDIGWKLIGAFVAVSALTALASYFA